MKNKKELCYDKNTIYEKKTGYIIAKVEPNMFVSEKEVDAYGKKFVNLYNEN